MYKEPKKEVADNVRVCISIALNRTAILQRRDRVIIQYGDAMEENEVEFGMDPDMVIFRLEIYDQVRFVDHVLKEGENIVRKQRSLLGKL